MIRELRLICKIWKWHSKQFKDLSQIEQEQKLQKEVEEFMEAKAKFIKANYGKRYKYRPHLLEETADVIIAGLNLLKYPEIFERVAIKHNQNTHRTWKGVQHDKRK